MQEAIPRRSSGHRILVIDDEPDTAQLVRSWFKNRSFDILSADTGERGVELARERDPDLILLDLEMPGLDGNAVARRLKADAGTRVIPILVLTGFRDINSKVQAFAAGADDYLTKPFECEEVEARIHSMLRRRETLAGLQSAVQQLTSTNEELEQLLMTDDKTGLFNFREFQRRLRQEWQRAERYGVPLSLVFFDLDHFKQLNDTLGHQAGDVALREFATLVTGGARANDVAARYGGEEFAVILPHTDRDMAVRVAERIRRAVAEFVFLRDETPTHITVSAGVATYDAASPEMATVDALVRAADRALYEAKDLGRDRTVQHLDRRSGIERRARGRDSSAEPPAG